jgi:protocatechuate 4,5-dioxygenase alpha chain|tara:strand:- start:100 stop:459 length:360 start_codon:yes stop_codon:yes gene_type:complete
MSQQIDPNRKIPGSYIFTGPMSQKGYALNKLGASLISDDARATFKANEESYMNKFGLNEEQKKLIHDRNWIGCVRGGANIYFLYKITTVFGDSLYKLGAKQAGMSYEEFLESRNVSGAV